MNDLEQIMNIFALAYQLLAKAFKQQPSQEGFLQVLEMLGGDGILECAKLVDLGPEAVALAMVQIIQQKQTQKAANGAKLKYIMQLLGKCQPGYLKSGGRCKPCEMGKGVFLNKADLLNKGGNVDWRKEAKRLTTLPLKSDSIKNNNNRPFPKFGEPKRNIKERPTYDEIKTKKKELSAQKYSEGDAISYSIPGISSGKRLKNYYNNPESKPFRYDFGSTMNRIWGNYAREGVEGEGTRFNPVELPEVEVVGISRYPYYGDREIYSIGGRKYEYRDRIYDNISDRIDRNDGPGLKASRKIYLYPDERRWWIPRRDTTYIKGNKKNFDDLLKKVSPKERKEMLRTK